MDLDTSNPYSRRGRQGFFLQTKADVESEAVPNRPGILHEEGMVSVGGRYEVPAAFFSTVEESALNTIAVLAGANSLASCRVTHSAASKAQLAPPLVVEGV